ncbi:UPF0598 protein C8orf82 homolog isoform X2 [Anoplophora glabripennis]|uniref:UPF0598 protein C8orf82 homolog isoform X2 n=1 Tax=Anoplophora glabripennis TaxID=217634 RepID=UPI0008751CBE|nr:UPF0598 protein C8orf82 homolog isoform X2 [Anoplophora glabripennis]
MITEIRNLILLSSSVKINKQGQFFRNVSYVQGQEPEPKIREYFYYIDHQGMMMPG